MNADLGRVRRSRWPFLSLIPLGLGAWAPIYAGATARRGVWIALGSVWSAIVAAGWIGSAGHRGNTLAGLLIVVGWVGAVATSFVIRSSYDRQMSSPLLAATEAGEQRLLDRSHAIELARRNPKLAREIGVGRPDVRGASDAGLVDVNNASVTALRKLPGVDGDLATDIVETREKVHGFSSLEDLGATLDLAGDVVEQLRGRVVFLPRD